MEKVFYPKLFSVLRQGYNRNQFQKDLFSGIIVGIVALPLAIAFAVASGVSPEKGIVTAIIAGFLISFLGGSRVQIGGPTGAFIVIVLGIVTNYGLNGLLISTILAGIILIVFGLLRLGAILKYIPYPLIVGFTSGIALVIFSTQVKDALGLTLENNPSGLVHKWINYFQNIDSTNFYALGLTILTILIIVFSKNITAKIPGSFIAIIVVTGIVSIFKIPVNTIETVFGNIPNKFHFEIPTIDWENISYYFQPALTIALLGAIESLLSAVVADGMISSTHRSNTELIAQGIANVISPIFGGIPATGAIARTATNIKNGGRTPIAGIIHAITLLLIMLFFGNLAKMIPMSCLAGILIVVSYNMSEWRSFTTILRGSRYDVIVLLTTFFLTILVDLTVAIEIGIVLASLLFMYRMSKVRGIFAVTPDNENLESYAHVPKGIEIYEISGPFFFAAAKECQEVLKSIDKDSPILIIRMRHVPFIDATGINFFRSTLLDLKSRKVRIILSGVSKDVYDDLNANRLIFLIGKSNIFGNFDEALKRAVYLLENLYSQDFQDETSSTVI